MVTSQQDLFQSAIDELFRLSKIQIALAQKMSGSAYAAVVKSNDEVQKAAVLLLARIHEEPARFDDHFAQAAKYLDNASELMPNDTAVAKAFSITIGKNPSLFEDSPNAAFDETAVSSDRSKPSGWQQFVTALKRLQEWFNTLLDNQAKRLKMPIRFAKTPQNFEDSTTPPALAPRNDTSVSAQGAGKEGK